MGFGPHNVYCSYKFPIMSYAYGPLWYNSLWLLLTFGMIVHAAARLLKYRSILSAAAKGASSSGQNNSKRGGTGGSGNKRNSSSANNSGSGTISLTMCYRFGVWGMIYLLIIGLANYRQTRAVFAGKYERSDMNLGVREFSGAVVGLAIWIIFGTGRAAWHASTIYVIYQRFKPAPRSVFNDGYDLRTYYNMPESGAAGSNSITNPQKPLGGVAVPSQAATSYRNDHPRNNPAVADPYRGYQGQGYQGQQQQQQQAQQQDYQDYKQQYGRGYTSRDDYDQGYSNGQAPYRY
ncbi:hypothetical protein DFJ77DRAFT_30965 [Powellomyces hirtus]|nr:hypothetical protein DFJ77DRAFT_30965 [Powellomyces hirtus]